MEDRVPQNTLKLGGITEILRGGHTQQSNNKSNKPIEGAITTNLISNNYPSKNQLHQLIINNIKQLEQNPKNDCPVEIHELLRRNPPFLRLTKCFFSRNLGMHGYEGLSGALALDTKPALGILANVSG